MVALTVPHHLGSLRLVYRLVYHANRMPNTPSTVNSLASQHLDTEAWSTGYQSVTSGLTLYLSHNIIHQRHCPGGKSCTNTHVFFAMESQVLYRNQNGALFPMLAIYNKSIPPGFPGEMNHINRSIVTLLSLWFESHLATYFSCLAGAEWILIKFRCPQNIKKNK